jgi:murein L,D-transpeptidase YafK
MLKRILLLSVLFAWLCTGMIAQSFKTEQQQAPRVKAAYAEKWEGLKAELLKKGIAADGFELLIRVLKHEKLVEVWLKPKSEKQFRLFKTYDICYYSGDLGPKRKQGDGQVPEGFYNVAVFNPYSSYHLSLGISYPNASDKIIGKGNPGGDIMIHGNCLSIGCIPITDVFIKELYVLAVEARNNGQSNIPVYIFPVRMDAAGMGFLNNNYESNAALQAFWKNLKQGYDVFEENKTLPKIAVDKSGAYLFR